MEEYRKRMQARHQAQKGGASPPAPRPIPPPSQDDERLARQLQEEEQRRADEELAKKLQQEDSTPPPANVQRVERLVDPIPYPAPAQPAEARRPLLPAPRDRPVPERRPQASNRESCWPESDRCCGMSDQFVVLVLAGGLTAAIVGVLFVLIYTP